MSLTSTARVLNNVRAKSASVEDELERIDRLANLLDSRFRIPLTPIRLGLDGIVGLIPGVGDTLMAIPSAYMLLRGWQLGARKRALVRMAGNSATDYAIGMIPFLGDILDMGFKGNLRNARILRDELTRPARRPVRWS